MFAVTANRPGLGERIASLSPRHAVSAQLVALIRGRWGIENRLHGLAGATDIAHATRTAMCGPEIARHRTGL